MVPLEGNLVLKDLRIERELDPGEPEGNTEKGKSVWPLVRRGDVTLGLKWDIFGLKDHQ